MPPFGTFRSELSIVAGGLAGGTGANTAEQAVAAVLVVLVTLAFLGLSWHMTQSMLVPASASGTDGDAAVRQGRDEQVDGPGHGAGAGRGWWC